MKRLPSMVRSVILMLVLYTVQFLLFPCLFPNYFRVSNEATALYWISFALVVLAGVMGGMRNIMEWLPGNVLYLICMNIYSANGAYNAQLDGHYRLKWFLLILLIYMAELLLFQLIIIVLSRILYEIFTRIRQ